MIARLTSPRMQEFAVYALLTWAALWRGGKSLESVWFFLGVGGFLTLAWYAEHRREKKQSEHSVHGSVWSAAIFFLLLTVTSYVASRTRTYGLDEVLATAGAMFVLFWTVRHRYRETFAQKFLRLLAILTVVACVIGVFVYTLQPVARFVGTFFDHRFHTDYWPNAWAQFLLLAWPSLLFCLLKARTRTRKILWAVALSLCFSSLFLSYSRGAMIAFAGQLVLLLFFFLPHVASRQLRSTAVASIAVLACALLLSFEFNMLRERSFETQSVAEKVTFTADEGTSSVSERKEFWIAAVTLMKERPLFGWGPYSFRFVQPRLQESVLATSDHPHNVFLKIGMERGIPALAAFLFLLGAILFSPFISLVKRKEQMAMPERMLTALLLTAIAGVLAHNLIDYNLQFTGIVFPLFVFLGIVCPRKGGVQRGAGLQRRIDVLLACALLIVALLEGRMLVFSSFARHAHAKGELDHALVWYDRADHEWFSRDMYLSRAQILIALERNDEAVATIERSLRENPEDARAWKMLGDLERGESALRAYEQAAAFSRYNDLSVTHAIMRTLSRTDSGAFLSRIDGVNTLLEKYDEAIQRNAHFIALSQNTEEFIALTNFLAARLPELAPKYEVMAGRAELKAREERGKGESRPPGFLW